MKIKKSQNVGVLKCFPPVFTPTGGGGEDVENVGNKSLTPLSII